MGRKTRRQSKHTRSRKDGIATIPELRRSFEYIEHVVQTMIRDRISKEEMVSRIRKEWLRVFRKELSKKSATEWIEDAIQRSSKKQTRKHRGGASLQGAPLLHDLRSGQYTYSTEGGIGDYHLLKGLSLVGIPEIAAPAKVEWPHPAPDMGSSRVNGGGRRLRRARAEGGASPLSWAFVDQIFQRPVSSDSPAGFLNHAQRAWGGQPMDPSSDQSQRQLTYLTMPGQIKPFSY